MNRLDLHVGIFPADPSLKERLDEVVPGLTKVAFLFKDGDQPKRMVIIKGKQAAFLLKMTLMECPPIEGVRDEFADDPNVKMFRPFPWERH